MYVCVCIYVCIRWRFPMRACSGSFSRVHIVWRDAWSPQVRMISRLRYVRVYVCICVCVHIYIHIYKCICIYVCMYVYMYVYAGAFLGEPVRGHSAPVHTCACHHPKGRVIAISDMHMHTYTHTLTHTYLDMCMCTHAHIILTNWHECAHTDYTKMYMYIHMHTHANTALESVHQSHECTLVGTYWHSDMHMHTYIHTPRTCTQLWNLFTNCMNARLLGHTDSVTALSFLPSGNHLISVSDDHSIRCSSACMYTCIYVCVYVLFRCLMMIA
jgi:hypothetical protein